MSALVAIATGLGLYKSGGVATDVKLPGGMQQQQFLRNDLSCEEYSILARLTPDGWFG